MAKDDLGEFATKMIARADKIVKNLNKTTRKAALAADQAVVLATPVDTSRARSNWITSLGSPVTSSINPYSPGKGGATGEASGQAAINQAAGVISQRTIGQDIYITNNLPYIQKLNEGSSAQAPAGFVQASVAAGISVIKNARIVDGN